MRADRGHSLDFIESAKRDAARSREILATVIADLNEHNRWFDGYLAEEKKKREQHARMLRRNRVTLLRQERHEQRLEAMKGSSLKAAAQTKATVNSFWGGVVSEVAAIKDGVVAGGAWTYNALNQVDSKTFQLAASGLSWTGARGGSLAKAGALAASAVTAGLAAASRSVAGATARAASAGAAWTNVKGRALAQTSASALSVAGARIAKGTHVVTDATTRAASTGLAWTESKGGDVAHSGATKLSVIGSGIAQKSRALGAATAHLTAAGLARSGAAARALGAATAHLTAAGLAQSGAAARTIAKVGSESLSGGSGWSARAARNVGTAIAAGSATGLAWMREKGQVAGTGLGATSSVARERARALSESFGPRLAGARDTLAAATKASASKTREGITVVSSKVGEVLGGSLAKLKSAAPEVHAVINETVQGVRNAAQISNAKTLIEEWRQKALRLADPEQIAAALEEVRRRGESGAETVARWTAGTKAERLGTLLVDRLKEMCAEQGQATDADLQQSGGEPAVEAEVITSRSTALVVYQPDLVNFPPLPRRPGNR